MRPTRYNLPTVPTYSIKDWGARRGSNLTDAQRTENTIVIQRAIDETIGDIMSNPFEGRGGDLVIPPGTWEINDTLEIFATQDALANFRLMGMGGRYTSELKQMNPSKGVLRVFNEQLNMRGVQIENLTLTGGTVGLETHNDEYNLYQNITFFGQTVYGVYGSLNPGLFSRYVNCWFSDISGNCVFLNSGRMWMHGCVFGEASGGLNVNTGRLHLVDCCGAGARDLRGIDTNGAGTPVIALGNGSKLTIDGGLWLTPNDATPTIFLYANQSDSILINGGEFIVYSNVTDFIVSRDAQLYNGPFNVRPSRIISFKTSGLSVYREQTANATHAHKSAMLDACIDYPQGGVAPTVDAAYTNVANNNTATLRSRQFPP